MSEQLVYREMGAEWPAVKCWRPNCRNGSVTIHRPHPSGRVGMIEAEVDCPECRGFGLLVTCGECTTDVTVDEFNEDKGMCYECSCRIEEQLMDQERDAHRGGGMSGAIFRKSHYLSHACTHQEFYGQFVNSLVKSRVLSLIGETAIANSTDEHFNDIPLKRWDALGAVGTAEQWKAAGDWPTMAGRTCIYKEAARQLKHEIERRTP